MSTGRKKPIKLDFETQLISGATQASDPVRVEISGADRPSARPSELSARILSGTVKLRREVKGRAGKPVTVIYDFSDPLAQHYPSLKQLQSLLKEKLACGGTVDEVECAIILQVDDLKKIRSALETMGFSVKG